MKKLSKIVNGCFVGFDRVEGYTRSQSDTMVKHFRKIARKMGEAVKWRKLTNPLGYSPFDWNHQCFIYDETNCKGFDCELKLEFIVEPDKRSMFFLGDKPEYNKVIEILKDAYKYLIQGGFGGGSFYSHGTGHIVYNKNRDLKTRYKRAKVFGDWKQCVEMYSEVEELLVKYITEKFGENTLVFADYVCSDYLKVVDGKLLAAGYRTKGKWTTFKEYYYYEYGVKTPEITETWSDGTVLVLQKPREKYDTFILSHVYELIDRHEELLHLPTEDNLKYSYVD